MKRSRPSAQCPPSPPSLANVQPVDLHQLADDLELSEQVRDSVQQVIDHWQDNPSPQKQPPLSQPMKLWASLKRMWSAVIPPDQGPLQRPAQPQRNRRFFPTTADKPNTHAPFSNSSARAERADVHVDPFFTPKPHSVQHKSPPKPRQFDIRTSKIPPTPSQRRRMQLQQQQRPQQRQQQRQHHRPQYRPQQHHQPLSNRRRFAPELRPTAAPLTPSEKSVQHSTTPSSPSPSSIFTMSDTPMSTPPKSPDLSPTPMSVSSAKPNPFFPPSASNPHNQHQLFTPSTSPTSPQPSSSHPPTLELHNHLASLSLNDAASNDQPQLDDFFDADLDESAVDQIEFPTDHEISNMHMLRARSQSAPTPRRNAPTTAPKSSQAPRKLQPTRTVMRVAKAALQDMERMASLRRRITGDIRVDRRLAHLRLLQSQLRARNNQLPSTEGGARERFTGALDRLRERKRQALIEQQRRLSSSWRVSKVGDVPRNVKLPPLRRPNRRVKDQAAVSSPTDIRRTNFHM